MFGTMNIFIPVAFCIVSQGYCESRDIIYDERANSVLSVFKILIKKELMFFYNGWSVFFATRVGRSYLQIGKAIYNLKK